MKAFPLLVPLATIQCVQAWGTLGHTTVAFVASNFVSSTTQNFLQDVLHNTSSTYLAEVATWADSFRYTQAGRFSAPFHFIDAEDNPPSTCSVVFNRDCGGHGCIVGAVKNYTTQLLDTTLPAWQRSMAAKFIVHFLGDIHQPLHTENLSMGGNGIKVFFDSQLTNLHHVWDTSIPEKLVGGYALPFALAWATNLTESIRSGIYAPVAQSWLHDMQLDDPIASALVWARDSNALVCTTVLKEGKDAINGTELGNRYYEDAIDVVQMQVAKAGLRLAAWMDLIADKVAADENAKELKKV